jgi:hypothetical protein
MARYAFGSFWHGPLTPLAYACLSSFARAGTDLTLFSYDSRLEAAPGVRRADARAIYPDESLVGRLHANGKPSLATFADMFRYRMIEETGLCWVDTDLICLREPEFPPDGCVFCRQADAVGTSLINNAVLRLPPAHPALSELIATAEAAIDADGKWGAIGPFLLTPILIKHGLYENALDSRVCYPIEPEQFWKLFLPEWRDWTESAVADSTFVHLWSEAIRWSGYDISACPPVGSFLHSAIERAGAAGRFSRMASEEEVRRVMAREIAAAG